MTKKKKKKVNVEILVALIVIVFFSNNLIWNVNDNKYHNALHGYLIA